MTEREISATAAVVVLFGTLTGIRTLLTGLARRSLIHANIRRL
jgi:hypothetical protein